jgi:hypothetical protein
VLSFRAALLARNPRPSDADIDILMDWWISTRWPDQRGRPDSGRPP